MPQGGSTTSNDSKKVQDHFRRVPCHLQQCRDRSQSLTEAEVLGNMFFYVMAGFGRISTTLSFVFLLLALHPSCQALLHQQVDQVLGSKPLSERNADEDLQQLLSGYLGAVINETLRLYHPVARYARKMAGRRPSRIRKARATRQHHHRDRCSGTGSSSTIRVIRKRWHRRVKAKFTSTRFRSVPIAKV